MIETILYTIEASDGSSFVKVVLRPTDEEIADWLRQLRIPICTPVMIAYDDFGPTAFGIAEPGRDDYRFVAVLASDDTPAGTPIINLADRIFARHVDDAEPVPEGLAAS